MVDNYFSRHNLFETPNIERIPKYRLIFVSGAFGDGKTLFLTNYAVENKNSYKKIYANYHIKKIKNFQYLKKVDKKTLFNLKPESLLVLQESYHYFDKRDCMKKANKEIVHALFQIRKLKIDIVADIPKLSYIDFRWGESATDFFKAYGELYEDLFLYARMVNINKNFRIPIFEPVQKFFIDAKNVYQYYDTFEKTYTQPQ